jgi:hypothetical protein
MSTKTTLALALAAGFLGGIASQHITIAPVFAQAPTLIPTEIRAQRFVAVDETGMPRAVFGINGKDGPSSANPKARQPIIEVMDPKGRLYWMSLAEGNVLDPNVRAEIVREKGIPTLLPRQ